MGTGNAGKVTGSLWRRCSEPHATENESCPIRFEREMGTPTCVHRLKVLPLYLYPRYFQQNTIALAVNEPTLHCARCSDYNYCTKIMHACYFRLFWVLSIQIGCCMGVVCAECEFYIKMNRGFVRRGTHLYAHDFALPLGLLFVLRGIAKNKKTRCYFWFTSKQDLKF